MLATTFQQLIIKNDIRALNAVPGINSFLNKLHAIPKMVLHAISSVDMFRRIMNATTPDCRFITISKDMVFLLAHPEWTDTLINEISPVFPDNFLCKRECSDWRDTMLRFAKTYQHVQTIMKRYCINNTIDEHLPLYTKNADWCTQWCYETDSWAIFTECSLSTLTSILTNESVGNYGTLIEAIIHHIDFEEFILSFESIPFIYKGTPNASHVVIDLIKWMFSQSICPVKPLTSQQLVHYISIGHWEECLEIIDIFLLLGMKINQHCTHTKKTILHQAVLKKYSPTVITYLLDRGADPSERNLDGHPILYDVKMPEVFALFLRHPTIQVINYPLLLNYAVKHQLHHQLYAHMNPYHISVFRRMTKTKDHKGVSVFHNCNSLEDVHFFTQFTQTIPYYIVNRRVGAWCENVVLRTVRKNLVELATFWIKFGVNPNCRDKNGDTVYHVVKDLELCKLIYSTGKVGLHSKNRRGFTPITSQADKGNLEIVKWMEEKGCLVDKKAGKSTLQTLSCVTNPDMAIHLVKQGHSPNYKNQYKRTAWMHWAQFARWDVFRAVMNICSIRSTAIDYKGNTILHLIDKNKFNETEETILYTLLEKNPKIINWTNSDGLRAINMTYHPFWVEKMVGCGSRVNEKRYLQRYYFTKLTSENIRTQVGLKRSIPTSVLPEALMKEISDFFSLGHLIWLKNEELKK